ncbi:MAG: HAMP domain-containing protein [Planctomycetaceae bacterium]|nr:HAMP domain-containing protein [Planctomycetaceae bacterium]
MQSRSFFTWLFTGNLILITLILILVSSVTFQRIVRQTGRKSEVIQKELLAAQREYLEWIWRSEKNVSLRDEQIRNFCRAFNNRRSRMRLTVIDVTGHVIGDSEEAPEQMPLHTARGRPEMAAALNGISGESLRFSETMRQVFHYFSEPVFCDNARKDGQAVAGVVRLAIPVSDTEEMHHTLFYGMVFGFALTLLAAVFPVFGFAWFWYRPIKELSVAARNISQGNLESVITVPGPLELMQLASAMEQMRQTVSAQLKTIEIQQENLRTIFNGLSEAIFAADAENRVLFVNRSAENLFAIALPENPVPLQSVLQHPTILAFYERAVTYNDDVREQIQIDLSGSRKVLELQMTKIPKRLTGGGIASLLIVRDQTEAFRTAEMKVEFVANASHELRTPLTTIRTVVDNLLDNVADDPETLRQLITILDRHVGRLEAMIRDLLDLHIVENSSIPNHFEPIRTEEIRDWISGLFYTKLLDKEITLRIDAVPFTFYSDPNRLHLIFQNIVDNAIKFSHAGSEVLLNISREEHDLLIRCSDHGCGIPQEEQKKVFDRFYQSKTAKSGDNRIRGTGLGMAIVKHAAERLGGKIVLESQPGKGTMITIRIPAAMKPESP